MKKVLITGGNRGLGLETAKQMGKMGFTVIISVRAQSQGVEALKELRAHGVDSSFLVMDVSEEKSVKNAFEAYTKQHKTLDVLINNAGVLPESEVTVSISSIEGWRAAFNTNLLGTVIVTQTFLPLIKMAPAGRIVNVSSILGSLGFATKNPGSALNAAYGASKAGVNLFTIGLARELKGTNVKVNSAHPGWVKTDMGGPNATIEVNQGVGTFIRLATLDESGPTGKFFHKDEELPW